MKTSILTLAVQVLAVGLLAFGLVLSISPIPVGAPIVLIALSILIMTNPKVAKRLRDFRRNHPGVDRRIRQIEEKTPGPIGEPLRRTDP
ncbi:MAG: hypothetical protein AAFV51_05120 [Pseudomonadota bacterium]